MKLATPHLSMMMGDKDASRHYINDQHTMTSGNYLLTGRLQHLQLEENHPINNLSSDWELTWNSENPRITPCFRHLVLSLFPCALLWLATVLYGLFHWRSSDLLYRNLGPSPWTLLAGCKQVLTCLLIVCTASQGSYLLVKESFRMDARVQYVSIIGKLVTYVLVLCLQVRQRRHGHLSSLRLAFFWTLHLVCEFFASPVFSLIVDDLTEKTDETLFVLGTVSLALVMSETFICHFTDPHYDSLFCESKTDEFLLDHQAPFSRLFFSWLNRLMGYGYKHNISVEDLDALRPDTRTSYVCRQFLNSWYREEEIANHSEKGRCRRGPSLCLSLLRVLWPWMLVAVCLELLYDFATLLPPIILDWLITFMDDDEPNWHGYVYALLLFVTAISCSLLMAHDQNMLIRSSVIPRSGLNAAIYRKVFRLSLGSRRSYSLGELCNLVTVDVQRVFELVWDVSTLWSNPLRIALTVALLWRYLGVACLAGVGVMVLLMVITTFVAVHTNKIQKTLMHWKDTRLRLMNEILNGIKVLKLFAWEPPFLRQAEEVRDQEMKAIRTLAFFNAFVVFLWILAPFLVAISSFVAFVLLDERNVLDPSIAFVSLTLFGKLRGAVSSIPHIITQVVQSRISIRRLIDFLLSEELDTSDQQGPKSPGNVLELENASFSWDGSETFLRNLTLTVERGDLIAVVGRVGAGKTALLTAILGEMSQAGGNLRLDKSMRIAYVPQSAWIQNVTLRQNVLFVNPMDKRKYDSVIRSCCLKPDLKQLPGGDLTEIGEKGINLSGGQKQRVNLARAVYHEADFYLLDDPLSAVDAHVAKSIFADVIGPKGKLSQKTRILVTHDLSVLPHCDCVVLMSEGGIVERGSYQELLQREDGELTRLVNEFMSSQEREQEQEAEATPSPDPSSLSTEDLKAQMRRIGNRLSRSLSRTLSVDKETADHPPTKMIRFTDNEKMELGRVRADVYCTYFRSAGIAMTCMVFAGFAAYQAFEIGANVWLSQWSVDPPLPDGTQDVTLRNFRMTVYGMLGLAQGTCVLLGALLLTLASWRASVRLHSSMLWNILRSPLAFFDITPLGRIFNRFSKDMNSVDLAIPGSLNSVVTAIASATGTLVVICANHPLFLVIMVPIAILYLAMQLFYIATSRQLRRLQSVTLSPVLSFFSESVQGASTVRAFGSQAFFTKRQDSLLDNNCKVFLNTTFVNRWLAVRLQLLGAVVVFVVALLAVLQRWEYSAALVGLTLSYALNVTDILAQMVRLMTQLETRMVSVERIDEYSKLEEEASWTTDHCNLSLTDWPSEGSIVFKGYVMRYRPNSPAVLKNIDLEIPGGQKVGVVGRTGAGKSSLAQALFRVVEPSDGALIIDGVDTAAIGLHDLRTKITVIPQDPVLFGGELRLNLDPTGEHSDAEVMAALTLTRMDLPAGGLATRLEEGGENLSVGQRQQVCLARALLKRTRILVLDEATAAVDLETDRLIQETIRSEFRDCTIITVAHRLHTVLDYDRILVMEKGKIAEDGPPDVLLKRTNSLFRELARSAGLL